MSIEDAVKYLEIMNKQPGFLERALTEDQDGLAAEHGLSFTEDELKQALHTRLTNYLNQSPALRTKLSNYFNQAETE